MKLILDTPTLSESEKTEIFESILYESIINGLSELDLNSINSKARKIISKKIDIPDKVAASKQLAMMSRNGGDLNASKKHYSRVLSVIQKLIKDNPGVEEELARLVHNKSRYGYDAPLI